MDASPSVVYPAGMVSESPQDSPCSRTSTDKQSLEGARLKRGRTKLLPSLRPRLLLLPAALSRTMTRKSGCPERKTPPELCRNIPVIDLSARSPRSVDPVSKSRRRSCP